MKIRIDTAGFQRDMEAFAAALEENTVAAVTDACDVIEADAKARCPRDTGFLRSSITSDVQPWFGTVFGRVGTNVDYAPYVHEGTGLFSRTGQGRKDVPWRWQDDKGEWHTTSGQKSQPFLEQAADAIFTEDCAKHFAAHSGRTGSVPKSATLKRTGRSGVPRRTPIWQKAKTIGVSNFLPDNLQNLLADCHVKNQLLHITSTDLPLLDFCRSHGILVGTYSPLPTAKPSRTPPFRKWRKNTVPPLSSASAALWSWVRLPSPKPQIPPTWRTTPRWTFPFPLKARRP